MALDIDALIQAASQARERAYAPYSNFPVGAALLTASGQVFCGCNVENASYALCICAERVALGSALAAGQRDLVALAVIADSPGPVSPCGACRQVMIELAPDLQVVLANLQGDTQITTARNLLPGAFTADALSLEPEA